MKLTQPTAGGTANYILTFLRSYATSMRVLVCGGRRYHDEAALNRWLDRLHKQRGPFKTLISGNAPGADRLAEAWAAKRGVAVQTFPANWKSHGRAAGPKRNAEMLKIGKPDLIIAFPGGTGTAHMVTIARQAGIDVKEVS